MDDIDKALDELEQLEDSKLDRIESRNLIAVDTNEEINKIDKLKADIMRLYVKPVNNNNGDSANRQLLTTDLNESQTIKNNLRAEMANGDSCIRHNGGNNEDLILNQEEIKTDGESLLSSTVDCVACGVDDEIKLKERNDSSSLLDVAEVVEQLILTSEQALLSSHSSENGYESRVEETLISVDDDCLKVSKNTQAVVEDDGLREEILNEIKGDEECPTVSNATEKASCTPFILDDPSNGVSGGDVPFEVDDRLASDQFNVEHIVVDTQVTSTVSNDTSFELDEQSNNVEGDDSLAATGHSNVAQIVMVNDTQVTGTRSQLEESPAAVNGGDAQFDSLASDQAEKIAQIVSVIDTQVTSAPFKLEESSTVVSSEISQAVEIVSQIVAVDETVQTQEVGGGGSNAELDTVPVNPEIYETFIKNHFLIQEFQQTEPAPVQTGQLLDITEPPIDSDNLIVDLSQLNVSDTKAIDSLLENLSDEAVDQSQPTPPVPSHSELIIEKTVSLLAKQKYSAKYLEYKAEYDALSEEQKTLGYIDPVWVPDSECGECMKCSLKFTLMKRRHHCRACGLLFCSQCCNLRIKLEYNTKEPQSRVCQTCYETLEKVSNLRKLINDASNESAVMQQIVPVLKKDVKRRTANDDANGEVNENVGNEQHNVTVKSVRFSDGIAPGSDLAEEPVTALSTSPSIATESLKPIKVEKSSSRSRANISTNNKSTFKQVKSFEMELLNRIKATLHDEANVLPPLVFSSNLNDLEYTRYSCESDLIDTLKADDKTPMIFYLLRNLKVKVKIVNCLCAVGQDELLFIIELNDNTSEETFPTQIILHIIDLYEKSCKSERVYSMNYSLYKFDSNRNETELFDNKDNIGFLYYTPLMKYTCLKNIEFMLPQQGFLLGLLLQKWEIPWAKLFPLRLFLAFGAHYKVYPCTHVSVRHRKPIYSGDIGHTIMNILCDLRNYQYTIPQINGLYITMTDNRINVLIPQSQYDLTMKSMNQSNEYVFSLASLNLNENCTTHLASIENETLTSYISKKISFTNELPKSGNSSEVHKEQIGLAFIVFNGSLKPTLNINLKQTQIEDGLMLQIDIDSLNKLKESLKAMQSYQIKSIQNMNELLISIDWYKGDFYLNKTIQSPIDAKTMCGVKSIRLFHPFEYVCSTKLLKWTELFLLKYNDSDQDTANDTNFNLNRFSEACSNAFYVAIQGLIEDLVGEYDRFGDDGTFKLGLRITVLNDTIKYEIGACGREITSEKYLTCLDNELIPILNQVNSYNINICVEFIFYVLQRFYIEQNIENEQTSGGRRRRVSSGSNN